MQFIWPIKAEYRIVELDEHYQNTIIARNARDYVWLMSRQPMMPENEYQDYVSKIKAMGYDINKLVKIPQKWDVPLKKVAE
jgi:apolipoprotein D and lipocalin family protein